MDVAWLKSGRGTKQRMWTFGRTKIEILSCRRKTKNKRCDKKIENFHASFVFVFQFAPLTQDIFDIFMINRSRRALRITILWDFNSKLWTFRRSGGTHPPTHPHPLVYAYAWHMFTVDFKEVDRFAFGVIPRWLYRRPRAFEPAAEWSEATENF